MVADLVLEIQKADYALDLVDDGQYDLALGESVYVNNIIGNPYEGTYEVTPAVTEQTLPTKLKTMEEDVTIHAVPYYEVSNLYGDTVYIASEVS